jgi:hypothetical protein
MELKFESFGLPSDGLTRVEEIEGYRCDALEREGWSMVGIATAPCGTESKLFGVYRMTSDVVLAKALEGRRSAEQMANESAIKVRDLERQIKDLMQMMARQSTSSAPVTGSSDESTTLF